MKPFTNFLLEFFAEDAKAAIKKIEGGQVKTAKWTTESSWSGPPKKLAYIELHDGMTLDIVPYAITTYAKQGRLRNSGKTKREVYIDIGPSSKPRRSGKTFGKAIGEGQQQDEKIAAAKQKAIQWFQKNLGLKLGEFDFRY